MWRRRSIEPKNSSTLKNYHCNRHYYSGISLPLCDFPLSDFLHIGFSEICLTHLHNFSAWISSIGNYPQYFVISLRALRPYSWDLPSDTPSFQKIPSHNNHDAQECARHNANAPSKIDPSVLSQRQLVQIVINLRWRLCEQRTRADRE